MSSDRHHLFPFVPIRLHERSVASVARIVEKDVQGKKSDALFEKDEANRPDTAYEALAKLRPAFRKDGTIPAGNAPGLNSGAAAMIVADRSHAETLGISPHLTASKPKSRARKAPNPEGSLQGISQKLMSS